MSEINEAIGAARHQADEVPFLRPPTLTWNKQRLQDEIGKLTPAERELAAAWRELYLPHQKQSETNWANLLAMEKVVRHRARIEAYGTAITDLWLFVGNRAVCRDVPELT